MATRLLSRRMAATLAAILLLAQIPSAAGMFFFGMVQGLNSAVAFQSFMGTIGLLLLMEFFLGFLDFWLKNKEIYQQMLKRIYGELTIMGVMSFGIVMIEATGANSDPGVHSYIVGVDCAHYLLFFTVIFFVSHSFFLMYVSHRSAGEYLLQERMDAGELVASVNELNPLKRFIFGLRFLPFSFERKACEYKILERIFKDTYWLPEEFDFAAYLTHAFEHHALRTMDIGLYNWLVLITLVVINYIRIVGNLGFNCGAGDAAYAEKAINDLTGEESFHEDGSHGHHRALGGDSELVFDPQCTRFQLFLMLACLILLNIFAFGVLIMARYYELKLLARAGIKSAGDTFEFISMLSDHEDKKEAMEEEKKKKRKEKGGAAHLYQEPSIRMSVAELKLNIDTVLDELEVSDEFEPNHAIYAWIVKRSGQLVEFLEDSYEDAKTFLVKLIANRNTSESASNIQDMLKKKAEQQQQQADKANGPRRPSTAILTDQLRQRRQSTKTLAGATTFKKQSLSNRERASSFEKRSGGDASPKAPSSHGHGHGHSHSRRDSKEFAKEGATGSVHSKNSDDANALSDSDGESDAMPHSLVEEFVRRKRREEKARARERAAALAAGRVAPAGAPGANTSTSTSTSAASDGSSPSPAAVLPSSSSSVRPAEIAPDKERGESDDPLSALVKPDGESRKNSIGSNGGSSSKVGSEGDDEAVILSDDFSKIFLLGHPKAFYFAVDVTIMFVCFYLAVWATNFVTITQSYPRASVLWQILLIFPVLVTFQMLATINKTVALIYAVCTLDLKLTLLVSNDQLEMDQVMAEMKDHTLQRIVEIFSSVETLDEKLEVVDALFDSIDKDGSGEIDHIEFRGLLRNLSLFYSDERFKKLYRAIDRDGGGTIDKSEYFKLLFPDDEYTTERASSEDLEVRKRQKQEKLMQEKHSPGSGGLGIATQRRASSFNHSTLAAFQMHNPHNPNSPLSQRLAHGGAGSERADRVEESDSDSDTSEKNDQGGEDGKEAAGKEDGDGERK